MQSHVTEIAPDLYRISTFHPDIRLQFNSFLVKDDEPFLMHTGLRKLFDVTRAAVARVIDPSALRWIGYSHFEPDECGALNEWLRAAPRAQAVCSFVGSVTALSDFAERAPRVLADGETLDLGRHRLRFLSTPHVPHGWDAGLFFDETARALLCSDLFFQTGDPPPVTESDIVGTVRDTMVKSLSGPMAHDLPYTPRTDATLARLAALEPRVIAAMHGSSFAGDGRQAVQDLATAIREVLGPPSAAHGATNR